ncbi:protein ALTERED PHOSPHATE STARVATION RESPONSE 1-like isoform X2 [Gastrolobium bilobum]|uniref:protein ALTERED PHOSPHATE STARVATION RESPONSE 1-like isoform X2 n=1 Tax=Gastrolobium bilobum TaxID=150636 RepID=UPI002AB3164F|nr:protein ALTERED PHOSPHATE STARVATION RESPONSE 1-like isoform X2 [Gastrolobium bilobum]
MGCASSKLDDLPAVALCRERCTFLDEAIHQRYALAAAHIAYINSLKAIGHSLNVFIHQDRDFAASSPLSSLSSSPLHSPPHKPAKHNNAASLPHHSDSDSGSHLHFHSDSDDIPSLHHSTNSSPMHLDMPHMNNYYENSESQSDYHHHQQQQQQHHLPSNLHMNFMRNKPTSSIVYEQRPMSPDNVYVGESSSSSSYYPYPSYPSYSSYPPQPYDPYSNPPPFYGSSSPYRQPPPPTTASKPPPPPPEPKASTWDFLNFFGNDDDKDYAQPQPYSNFTFTPSRDSKDLREEEGIPDLEDEDYQHEVVKQVHGDQKLVEPHHEASRAAAAAAADNDHGHGVEYEVHVMDKKVVDEDDDRAKSKEHAAFRGGPRGSRNPLEVAKEIQLQFQRASDSGVEIAKILEVGKLPHNRKHGAYQASSKMLHVVVPSLSMVSSQPSTSKSAESASTNDIAAPGNLDFDVDLATRSRNLSSTLQKLYLWEKKLFNEVKAEEKMRVMHDRKCHKLKRLDERGADFHKFDSTRTLIRDLSTKIRMAIQVVDKISMTINKIRDEELWPQLKELIHGLTRMWKSMLECHHSQREAIREARILGPVGSRKRSGDSHLEATKHLEQELINWTFQFSGWISAQKGYVRALNSWLLKCLLYEPEETPDGIVPFSPSRIGAPQIFVICNQWSQALDRISEKEVVDSMHVFTMSVLQIWEQDKLEMHRLVMQNKDLERKVRNIDRDDQKLQKQIQALERKMVLASGEGKGISVSENIIYQSNKSSSLQASLQRIFEAMERFTDESVKAYEELLQRSEEVSAARDQERVS